MLLARMLRVRFLTVVLAVLLLGLSPNGTAAADGRFKVCLDPGHGGSDQGAVRGALVEKELTLDIAERVRAALNPAVYDVALTRNDNNTTLGNSERAQICNSFGAQIVLSVHLNASTDPNVDYAWFFYGKPLKDRAFTSTMDANYQIQNAYGTGGLPHKAITNFANGTLLRSNAPASLAECLFLSETREQELLLATDASSRRQEIASALVLGIRAFVGR